MDTVPLEKSESEMEPVRVQQVEVPAPVAKKAESVEEKLEERYNKLKLMAIKLKKRVAEQAEEINALEEDKVRLTQKNQTALTIQQEFDIAQDEIERLKKSESTLQKDLKSALDANVKLKEMDFEKSNQIQSLTTSHKFLREKVDKAENMEDELSVWKLRAKELESELKEVKQTEKDALQEKRQTAIMSLEITDYEKKLQIAHDLLENSKIEIQTQTKQIEIHEATIKSLVDKIDVLENRLEQLTSNKENLQTDVQRKAEKITFLHDEVTKANEAFHEKKTELFRLEAEYENCKLSFASESKSLVEKNSMLQKTVSALEHKISALEENKRSRESQISNQKLEMQQLETEFRNYKVKAQAMLKSQQPNNTSTVSQEKDELENLQRIVQDFHSEISLLKSDLQTLRLENENLNIEKSEVHSKLKNIKTELLEKEVRLNGESHKYRSDIRAKDMELKKIHEEHQIERDILVASYKDQTDTMKCSLESKIKALKEQVELLKIGDYGGDTSLKPSPSSDPEPVGISKEENVGFRPIVRESPFGCNTNLSQNNLERLQQPLTIDTSGMSFDQLRMMPRGECEGSESVNSTYLPRADNYNVSFEQLLSSSFDSFSKNSSDSDTPGQRTDLTPMIKEELMRCKNQIKHLTSLLRESESNCERLTQLSEALKEEIRRVERDQERKEHLQENSEYLKNVLLKFITLSGEDERLRLIPVFKTMLKLAPEEVTRLETAVKGDQQMRDNGNKGWSSYLQKWAT